MANIVKFNRTIIREVVEHNEEIYIKVLFRKDVDNYTTGLNWDDIRYYKVSKDIFNIQYYPKLEHSIEISEFLKVKSLPDKIIWTEWTFNEK